MSIGSNIRRRRFELNMSQDELAKALGYKTRSTIAKIESGENSLSLEKLIKFAEVLETTLDDLITSSDITKPLKKTPNALDYTKKARNIAVILAGGKSSRNDQNIPTQFVSILGKPLIIYTIETYQKHPSIDEIILVCLKGWEDILQSYVDHYKLSKVTKILTAGDTAILSAENALDYITNEYTSDNSNLIIYQEATRPLVPESLISKLLYSAREHGTAITSESMQEYIQFYQTENSTECLDRNRIIAAKGPEAYTYQYLFQAFEKGKNEKHIMQESCCYMFMYNLGIELWFEESSRNNIKIVRQEDILLLEALLKRQRQ